MFHLWKMYGFEVLFLLSIGALVLIWLYNYVGKEEGTYNDHTSFMWNLLEPRRGGPEHKVKKDHTSKGEHECRQVAEEYYGRSFPRCRPSFLRNDVTGGNNLEIDCYNDDLKIGIEYNGIQHYRYTPYFHKTKDSFFCTKYRDRMKRDLCEANGVRLIVVPYTVDDIKTYLRDKFLSLEKWTTS